MDVRFAWWQCVLSIAGGRWRHKTARVLGMVRLAFLDLGLEIDAATVALDEALTLALAQQWEEIPELLTWSLTLLAERGAIAEIARTRDLLEKAVSRRRLIDLAIHLGVVYCRRTGFPKYPAAVAAGLI
jgi:hypothetical protein